MVPVDAAAQSPPTGGARLKREWSICNSCRDGGDLKEEQRESRSGDRGGGRDEGKGGLVSIAERGSRICSLGANRTFPNRAASFYNVTMSTFDIYSLLVYTVKHECQVGGRVLIQLMCLAMTSPLNSPAHAETRTSDDLGSPAGCPPAAQTHDALQARTNVYRAIAIKKKKKKKKDRVRRQPDLGSGSGTCDGREVNKRARVEATKPTTSRFDFAGSCQVISVGCGDPQW